MLPTSTDGITPIGEENEAPEAPPEILQAINKVRRAKETGNLSDQRLGQREFMIGIQNAELKRKSAKDKELMKLQKDYLKIQNEFDLMGSTEQAVKNYLKSSSSGDEEEMARWGSVISAKSPETWQNLRKHPNPSVGMQKSTSNPISSAISGVNRHFSEMLQGGQAPTSPATESPITDTLLETDFSANPPVSSPEIEEIREIVMRLREKGISEEEIERILRIPKEIDGNLVQLSDSQINMILNSNNSQMPVNQSGNGRSMRDILLNTRG